MAQFTLTLALADFIAMGKVIAVANQKGGTGKTSCAVHLLHWCSQRGSTLGSPCNRSAGVFISHFWGQEKQVKISSLIDLLSIPFSSKE